MSSNSLSLHFQENEFTSRQSYLPDRDYGKMLDNCVPACVDVAVMRDSLLLVGKRKTYPYRDGWWIVGGKMNPGERREETARRVVEREVGVRIEELKRFIDLGLTMDFVWEKRAQQPTHHGCHMLGMYYMVQLDLAERDQVQLSGDFIETRWINVNDVARGMPQDIKWHEAIQRVADAVVASFSSRRWFSGQLRVFSQLVGIASE